MLEPWTSVHREHEPRHGPWPQAEPAVFDLIALEILGLQAFGKYYRLAECHAEAFARNRVDSARGVSDERYIASPYSPKCPVASKGASFRRGHFAALQPLG